MKISTEIHTVGNKIDKLTILYDTMVKDGKSNTQTANNLKNQISNLQKRYRDLITKQQNVDPDFRAINAHDYGQMASWLKKKKKNGCSEFGVNHIDWTIDDNVHRGRREVSKNRWRSTGKPVKESVLEEIYEAELCGDITPEERMALIDYMDM